MPAFPTPAAAALDRFGVSGAHAVCTVVEGDLAAVIVLAPAYDPPVTRLYRLAHKQDGWRVTGMGLLGLSWGATVPGERGVIAFGVEVPVDIIEVHLRIDQAHHVVPTPGGYGALIAGDMPPEPSLEVTSYLTADGRSVSGPPPPARTFTKQADPVQLAAIDDARHFVWATQLQVERFVAAFRRDVGTTYVPLSVDDKRRVALVFAEAEFLLNAAAQADKALRRVVGGPQLTEQMAKDIRLLRNLHEHWDEQKPSFAHPGLTKNLAGKDFAARHPAERPWEFKFGSSGHWISVLQLEDLWDELELIDRELGRLSNAVLAGTAIPHIVEDENRPLRPMPQPANNRTLARGMLRQPLLLGEP